MRAAVRADMQLKLGSRHSPADRSLDRRGLVHLIEGCAECVEALTLLVLHGSTVPSQVPSDQLAPGHQRSRCSPINNLLE